MLAVCDVRFRRGFMASTPGVTAVNRRRDWMVRLVMSMHRLFGGRFRSRVVAKVLVGSMIMRCSG
jgi:hypothetical protein